MTKRVKRTLSSKFKKQDFTVAEGVISPVDKLYYAHMPTGVTKAIEKKLDTYRTDFVAGCISANADTVATQFSGDTELDAVKIEGNLGESGGHFSARITRSSGDDDDKQYGHTVLTVSTPMTTSRKSGTISDSLSMMADAVANKIADN